MSESDLLAAIIDAARLLGIRSAHFRPAQTKRGAWVTPVAGDGKGWPDLILCGRRLLIREVKVGRNKPTPEQRRWLDDLRAAGIDADVWTDRDWPERVMSELREAA